MHWKPDGLPCVIPGVFFFSMTSRKGALRLRGRSTISPA